MPPAAVTACLKHLEAVETLMTDAGDYPGLSRLAFVIDMVRRDYGLPDRPFDERLLDSAPLPLTG